MPNATISLDANLKAQLAHLASRTKLTMRS